MGKLKSPKAEATWRDSGILQEFWNLGLRRACMHKIKGTLNAKVSNVELSSSLCVR
jgi:hypothetical protein